MYRATRRCDDIAGRYQRGTCRNYPVALCERHRASTHGIHRLQLTASPLARNLAMLRKCAGAGTIASSTDQANINTSDLDRCSGSVAKTTRNQQRLADAKAR